MLSVKFAWTLGKQLARGNNLQMYYLVPLVPFPFSPLNVKKEKKKKKEAGLYTSFSLKSEEPKNQNKRKFRSCLQNMFTVLKRKPLIIQTNGSICSCRRISWGPCYASCRILNETMSLVQNVSRRIPFGLALVAFLNMNLSGMKSCSIKSHQAKIRL